MVSWIVTVGLLHYNAKKILVGHQQGHTRVFKGSFCTVKKCSRCSSGKRCNNFCKKVAVKRILDVDAVSIEREEKALSRLDHPNIVKLYRVESNPNFRYFGLEWCAASLSDYCNGRYDGPMPSNATVLLHIASGLAEIHSKKFAHRKIQPKNILISETLPVLIKIADFGLTKPVTENDSYSVSEDGSNRKYDADQSMCWKSPEMLDDPADEGMSEKRGSLASDTFATGCVTFYFLTGHHPFRGRSNSDIAENIRTGNAVQLKELEWDDEHNGVIRQLIVNMVKKEPKERKTMEEVRDVLKELVEVFPVHDALKEDVADVEDSAITRERELMDYLM